MDPTTNSQPKQISILLDIDSSFKTENFKRELVYNADPDLHHCNNLALADVIIDSELTLNNCNLF